MAQCIHVADIRIYELQFVLEDLNLAPGVPEFRIRSGIERFEKYPQILIHICHERLIYTYDALIFSGPVIELVIIFDVMSSVSQYQGWSSQTNPNL